MMAVNDMEVAMRRLLTGSLVLMAAVVLLATGCEKVAQVPDGQMPGDNDASSYREDVAGAFVTAPQPAWVMPEVVVRASQMPEVVVRALRVPAPVVLSALPSAQFVN
jgi:hypothetical protein